MRTNFTILKLFEARHRTRRWPLWSHLVWCSETEEGSLAVPELPANFSLAQLPNPWPVPIRFLAGHQPLDSLVGVCVYLLSDCFRPVASNDAKSRQFCHQRRPEKMSSNYRRCKTTFPPIYLWFWWRIFQGINPKSFQQRSFLCFGNRLRGLSSFHNFYVATVGSNR